MTRRTDPRGGRPQEYSGALTAAQIAAGMNAACKNATRLVTDARLLLEAKRVPSAVALAALSIEESGKVSLLREFAIIHDGADLKQKWRRYRDHRSKNGKWILPNLVRDGARRLDSLALTIERDSEHTALLNSLKQLGFYTDCYGNVHWSEPDRVFSGDQESLGPYLVHVAELLVPKHETTVREIELWMEHMKPVWGTAEMRFAVVRFQAAMVAEGLSDTTPAEMAAFLRIDPSDWTDGSPRSN
jgi:AbiV family abortive infection protein